MMKFGHCLIPNEVYIISKYKCTIFFFRIELNDGVLKRFLDEGKNMSPSDRGELLKKADDIISTHKEIAIEGQTAVNVLNYCH